MYYPYSKNKGADQLRSYWEADLCLCFVYADCWFSHEAAFIMSNKLLKYETNDLLGTTLVKQCSQDNGIHVYTYQVFK